MHIRSKWHRGAGQKSIRTQLIVMKSLEGFFSALLLLPCLINQDHRPRQAATVPLSRRLELVQDNRPKQWFPYKTSIYYVNKNRLKCPTCAITNETHVVGKEVKESEGQESWVGGGGGEEGGGVETRVFTSVILYMHRLKWGVSKLLVVVVSNF